MKDPKKQSKFGKPLGFNSFQGKAPVEGSAVTPKAVGGKFNPTLFKGPQHKG